MHPIIQTKLDEYEVTSSEDRKHALREILQEITLYSLSANGFFKRAAFHGGTELRLMNALPRFSEDLDFVLTEPSKEFLWSSFSDSLVQTCSNYGLSVSTKEIVPKTSVSKLMLLDTVILQENNTDSRTPFLRIRLEIYTNPPSNAMFEIDFLDFPIPHEIRIMDLSSSFALKCHALLCRPWVKGRDWFDFLWFTSKNIQPNYDLCSTAFEQTGPWAKNGIRITPEWLKFQLRKKVSTLDWNGAKRDIAPFLSVVDRRSLSSWCPGLFSHYITRIKDGF